MAHTVVTGQTAPEEVTPVVPGPEPRGFSLGTLARYVVLALGAFVFLFPFYYMLVGSFQAKSDTSIGGAFPIGGWTLNNYNEINSGIDLVQSLVNSGIFTGGVILCDGRLRGARGLRPGACSSSAAAACCSPRCCSCCSCRSSC